MTPISTPSPPVVFEPTELSAVFGEGEYRFGSKEEVQQHKPFFQQDKNRPVNRDFLQRLENRYDVVGDNGMRTPGLRQYEINPISQATGHYFPKINHINTKDFLDPDSIVPGSYLDMSFQCNAVLEDENINIRDHLPQFIQTDLTQHPLIQLAAHYSSQYTQQVDYDKIVLADNIAKRWTANFATAVTRSAVSRWMQIPENFLLFNQVAYWCSIYYCTKNGKGDFLAHCDDAALWTYKLFEKIFLQQSPQVCEVILRKDLVYYIRNFQDSVNELGTILTHLSKIIPEANQALTNPIEIKVRPHLCPKDYDPHIYNMLEMVKEGTVEKYISSDDWTPKNSQAQLVTVLQQALDQRYRCPIPLDYLYWKRKLDEQESSAVQESFVCKNIEPKGDVDPALRFIQTEQNNLIPGYPEPTNAPGNFFGHWLPYKGTYFYDRLANAYNPANCYSIVSSNGRIFDRHGNELEFHRIAPEHYLARLLNGQNKFLPIIIGGGHPNDGQTCDKPHLPNYIPEENSMHGLTPFHNGNNGSGFGLVQRPTHQPLIQANGFGVGSQQIQQQQQPAAATIYGYDVSGNRQPISIAEAAHVWRTSNGQAQFYHENNEPVSFGYNAQGQVVMAQPVARVQSTVGFGRPNAASTVGFGTAATSSFGTATAFNRSTVSATIPNHTFQVAQEGDGLGSRRLDPSNPASFALTMGRRAAAVRAAQTQEATPATAPQATQQHRPLPNTASLVSNLVARHPTTALPAAAPAPQPTPKPAAQPAKEIDVMADLDLDRQAFYVNESALYHPVLDKSRFRLGIKAKGGVAKKIMAYPLDSEEQADWQIEHPWHRRGAGDAIADSLRKSGIVGLPDKVVDGEGVSDDTPDYSGPGEEEAENQRLVEGKDAPRDTSGSVLSQTTIGASIDDVFARLDHKLTRSGTKEVGFIGAVGEIFDKIKPVLLRSRTESDLLGTWALAKDLNQLAQHLMVSRLRMKDKAHFSHTLIQLITTANQAMTKAVNELLKRINSPITISDFMLDMLDLTSAVRRDHGQEILDLMEGLSQETIERGLDHINTRTDDRAAAYISSVVPDRAHDDPENPTQVILLRERQVCVSVNATSEDLGIQDWAEKSGGGHAVGRTLDVNAKLASAGLRALARVYGNYVHDVDGRPGMLLKTIDQQYYKLISDKDDEEGNPRWYSMWCVTGQV
jgi:hypothetical protein